MAARGGRGKRRGVLVGGVSPPLEFTDLATFPSALRLESWGRGGGLALLASAL